MNHGCRVTTPGPPVRHGTDGGIGRLQFACKGGFGHAGHADDIRAIAFQPVDFCRRFQPRALRGRIDRRTRQRHLRRLTRAQ